MKPTRRTKNNALPTYLRRDCHGQSDDKPAYEPETCGWHCCLLDGYVIYDMLYYDDAVRLAETIVSAIPSLEGRVSTMELLDCELTYLEDIPGMDRRTRGKIIDLYDSLGCF
jgi:hypothetical protein